ncbi:PhoX family phosphatase [Schlegelella sp. S2-27]|uniref:PhoX family phosphatase n=1 Tax=Caldimonas mangrovi TaxID=2944811 RepID=A0ABT0YT34_9BURK|nr:PhoX family phosphatase [Caldimonas mangrovi]MCM5681900.1 PhoX family phosphatase [Caldimonas mangrovi]
MAKDYSLMEDSNRSSNRSIHDISDPSRRIVLRGGLGMAIGRLLAPVAAGSAGCASGARGDGPLLGFSSVPVSTADKVVVPEGYIAQVIAAWGEPVGLYGETPAFKFDGSNSAAEQEAQMGMHHDGMHFYAQDGSRSGLLVMNHEYADDGLLHADGMKTWTAEKVRKSQAAHGVSVIEVEQQGDDGWQVVRPSPWARRITACTPMSFGGPAAGHALLRTAADPAGRRPLGTLSNCGSGITPWGTYLTCEENFSSYFNGPEKPSPHERRWGLRKGGAGCRWHEFDERFDATRHPNEPNRFGWIVEIDPFDPGSTPVKRTALGRATHEGATVAVTRDGRAVVYMGEDARFEYIYKFVSREKIKPRGLRENAQLLDHGTLYVARFDADGRGRWIALGHGQGPLTAENGFADQGEVLVKTRQASDLLGATKMDRPEWIAVGPDGWVYCTLTNNSNRGTQGEGVDAANPRRNNTTGHILRWKEEGDVDGTRFRWTHFVLAGDPANERVEAQGNIKGDAFGCPDGLWADGRGVLWVQTDMSPSAMGKGDLTRLGNNAMLAADPHTGEIRRFLVGPVGCEVTGATGTPDGRTLFVNIQHPGERPSGRSDPEQPGRYSNWPDARAGGRPRSATVVIRKADGGPIGT